MTLGVVFKIIHFFGGGHSTHHHSRFGRKVAHRPAWMTDFSSVPHYGRDCVERIRSFLIEPPRVIGFKTRQTSAMASILRSMKFSANIPDQLLLFLDGLVQEGHYKSRSQALTEACTRGGTTSWRPTTRRLLTSQELSGMSPFPMAFTRTVSSDVCSRVHCVGGPWSWGGKRATKAKTRGGGL